jgi:hypothetical protein
MYFASSGGGGISPEWDSYNRRESMVDDFVRFLKIAAVVFLVELALCVWEFTIGIKKSIKNLYKGRK